MSFPPKTGSSLDVDKLDAIFRKMIEEDLVPGLVVYARRGNHIYHKALALRIWQPSLHMRPCRMNPVRPVLKVAQVTVALEDQQAKMPVVLDRELIEQAKLLNMTPKRFEQL